MTSQQFMTFTQDVEIFRGLEETLGEERKVEDIKASTPKLVDALTVEDI